MISVSVFVNQILKRSFLLFHFFLFVFLPLFVHAAPNTDLKEAAQRGINQTSPLTAKIEPILKDERLAGAVTGISIRKAGYRRHNLLLFW